MSWFPVVQMVKMAISVNQKHFFLMFLTFMWCAKNDKNVWIQAPNSPEIPKILEISAHQLLDSKSKIES